MLLASTLGQIAHPFYELFAWILAGSYQLVPNYAIAIAMLTIVVMIVVFPLTLRSTRSMMKMQLLAPELKRLQSKYKVAPGMSVPERQEMRQRQQEEMMALYKENGVSPTGGCLPMLLQMPMLIILYGTIRGLIHTTKVNGHTVYQPLYISKTSKLYHAVVHAHGELKAFGVNLADSVRSANLSWPERLPFIFLILLACGLLYVSMTQMTRRNPQAAAANPQMQQMQKFMPILFAIFYINVPAGVNVYFIVSALFRIGQQEFMYRRDPHIQQSMSQLRARSNQTVTTSAKNMAKPANGERPKGMLARLTSAVTPPALDTNGGQAALPTASNGSNGSNGGRRKPATSGAKSAPAPRQHPRAQGKRPRRPR